jgi:hypothetical protein
MGIESETLVHRTAPLSSSPFVAFYRIMEAVQKVRKEGVVVSGFEATLGLVGDRLLAVLVMKVLLAGAGHSSAEERRDRSLGDSGHRDSIPKSCSQSQASTISFLFLFSPKIYFSLLSFLSGLRPVQSTRI